MGDSYTIAGQHYGSVFVKCTFLGPPPAWAVAEDRLRAAEALFAELPTGSVPGTGPLPEGSWLPHAPNPMFVGRQAEMRAVAAALKQGEATALCPPVGLDGIGGVGKTQTAAELAHRYGRWFAGGVFWLDCAEPASLDSQVARLGTADAPSLFDDMKLEAQCQAVLRLWASPMPRLLVFDNLEDDALLHALRPKQGGSRVLVTSRRSEWGAAHGLRRVPVETLPRAESLRLLGQFRPDLPAGPGSDLDAIAEELGDLPLALHLAGAFLREHRREPEGEPARYRAALLAVALDHPSLTGAPGASGVADPSPTGHDRHVARTFALSWDRLDQAAPVDALARQAMACAAWCAPRVPIPRALLTRAVRRMAGEAQAPVGQAIARLVALGLATEEGDDPVLHRLLARFAATATADVATAARDSGGEALADCLFAANETGLPATAVPLVPHAEHLLATLVAEAPPPWLAVLLNNFGSHENMRGDLAGAKARYERALAISTVAFGEDHPNVATGLNNLADVLRAQGDLAGAKARFERALAIDTAAFGEDHPNVAIRLNNLASVLRAQGDLAGAKARYERALAIFTAAFGEDHPNVATGLNNLARVLKDQGDLAGAKARYERALAIDTTAFGEDHPKVATGLNNLARVLEDQGDLAGAKARYERTLAIDTAAFGEDHPNVATDLNNLALVLRAQGDLAGAKVRFERALAIVTRFLGPDHPSTRIVRANLAVLPPG